MKFPGVLVLESGHLLGNLLRSRCPERTWVLHQVRALNEVQEALVRHPEPVLVVEIAERFVDVLGWVRQRAPGSRVIGILADEDARLDMTLLDLGVLACVPRSQVFERLPALVERVLRTQEVTR